MLKEKTSNFYLLVETSNYIINQMSIKYFRLWKNEKIKQVPHQELALEYEKKYKKYFNLMNDYSFFQNIEKMQGFIKNHSS
jgi:hypothetical protein